jgi:hypothetical protein
MSSLLFGHLPADKQMQTSAAEYLAREKILDLN